MISIVCPDMPDDVQMVPVYDEEFEYIIFINENLSPKEQAEIFRRELENIRRGLYVEEVVRSSYQNTTVLD